MWYVISNGRIDGSSAAITREKNPRKDYHDLFGLRGNSKTKGRYAQWDVVETVGAVRKTCLSVLLCGSLSYVLISDIARGPVKR